MSYNDVVCDNNDSDLSFRLLNFNSLGNCKLATKWKIHNTCRQFAWEIPFLFSTWPSSFKTYQLYFWISNFSNVKSKSMYFARYFYCFSLDSCFQSWCKFRNEGQQLRSCWLRQFVLIDGSQYEISDSKLSLCYWMKLNWQRPQRYESHGVQNVSVSLSLKQWNVG